MKSIRCELKQLLKGYTRVTPKIEKGLKKMGIVILRKNKHTILEYLCADGTVAHSAIAGSCSDPCGGLNLASEIAKRMGA